MKVIFTWMEGKHSSTRSPSVEDSSLHLFCIDSECGGQTDDIEKEACACEFSRAGKRKHFCSECSGADTSGTQPINDILHWHSAIKKELDDIAKEARRIEHSQDFKDLSAFNARLQFIADVCIFHRYV